MLFESTLGLLARGYDYGTGQFHDGPGSIALTRLLLQRTALLRGSEALTLF